MIGTASRAVKFAYHPPEGVILQDCPEEYFRPFGYTIYRTAYDDDDPEQDQAWGSLLDRLYTDFKLEISNTFSRRQHIESERQDTDKLKSLARFDGRSDATLLNGCSVENLRTIFEAGVGGAPLNVDASRFKYFLFADKDVLDGVAHGESWVKIAELLYDDAKHNAKSHPHLPSKQTYFGWMKVSTGSLFFTRMWLENMTLRMLSTQARGAFPITDELFPVMETTRVVEAETRWEKARRLGIAIKDLPHSEDED
ncbi:hypothetical protein LEL_06114 [Akanthomyces lecanii RCEF 1005]|uniref:Uncharacterized protein n=1 Tax=Akanthomyces lecanii RCEF 1005 TaxID=1081108 RepID=A0A168GFQ4_CORDF|nr:hypothetical protein LEL_06114 [Akanthomyces lecanii RCEF 1005]